MISVNKLTKENNVINKILSGIFEKPVQIAFELECFRKYREFKDGIDALRIEFTVDLKGDHTPHKKLFIGFFNIKIIEMGVYNINHEPTVHSCKECKFYTMRGRIGHHCSKLDTVLDELEICEEFDARGTPGIYVHEIDD